MSKRVSPSHSPIREAISDTLSSNTPTTTNVSEFDVENLPSMPILESERNDASVKTDHSLDLRNGNELSAIERSVENCLEFPATLTKGKRKIFSVGFLCVAVGAAVNLAYTGLQRDAAAVTANALSSFPAGSNLRPVLGYPDVGERVGVRSSLATIQKYQDDLKQQYPYNKLPPPPNGQSQHQLHLGSDNSADIQGQYADYVGLVQPPPSKQQYLAFVERESAVLNLQYRQQQMADGTASQELEEEMDAKENEKYRQKLIAEGTANEDMAAEENLIYQHKTGSSQNEAAAVVTEAVQSAQPSVVEEEAQVPQTFSGLQGEVGNFDMVKQLIAEGEAKLEEEHQAAGEPLAGSVEVQEPSLLTQLMVEASQQAEANLDAEGQVIQPPAEDRPAEDRPAEDRPTDADMAVLQQEIPLTELNNFKDSWDPYEKSDNPVFWHIPKAGGSTVKDIIGTCHRFVMATEFGVTDGHIEDTEIAVVYPATGNPDQDRSPFVNVDTTTVEGISRAAQMGFADSGLAEAIVTPFIYEANELFTQTARGRLFTVFRHPIERAVSMFYYLQVADWEPTYNPEMKTWTLEQYATSPVIENNWMVRQLSHTFEGDLNEDHLKVAMEVVRRKFLVGLMSEMEATVDRFEKFFRWTYHVNPPNQEKCRENLLHGGSNSNAKNKKKGPEPGSKEWELLSWQNQYDLRLYDYIEVLFKEQEAFVTGIPDNYRNMDATCCKCDPPTFPPEGFTCPQAIKG